MAYFLGLILLIISFQVHASFSATNATTYSIYNGGFSCGGSSSAAAACSCAGGDTNDGYYCYLSGTPSTYKGEIRVSSGYTCPTNSTISGTTCTCNTGFTQSGSTCNAQCPNLQGQYFSVTKAAGSSGLPPLSIGGCTYQPAGCACAGIYCECDIGSSPGVLNTGGSGGGGTEPVAPTNTPEGNCVSQGKSYGYVNGAVICVKPNTAGAAPYSQSNTSNTYNYSDGTTTSTNPGVPVSATNNGNGTVTLWDPNIVNPDGSTGKTVTETLADFCKDNPTSPICTAPEPGTVSGGTDCTAPPLCSGDPVQCAQLATAWQSMCVMQTPTDSYAGGVSAMDGIMPDGLNSEVNVGNTLDTSTFLGSGCFQDVSVPVPGGSITLPFSELCAPLEGVGNAIVAMALLISIRIVGVT